MPLRRPSISAVIPMHNEAPYVVRCLSAVQEALAHASTDWEIVVVDDASTDETAAFVRARSEAEPRIRLVQNEKNLTLGGTLRVGFATATKDLIFYTDADLPFDAMLLAKAERLLRYLRADLFVAYRLDRTSEGLVRSIYSFFWNWLIRILLKVQVRDINFSFKLFRRAILPGLALKSNGSFIDAELVAKAWHKKYKVIQIGVDYFPRTIGVSKLSSLKTIKRMTGEMFRLRGEVLRGDPEAPTPVPPAESIVIHPTAL